MEFTSGDARMAWAAGFFEGEGYIKYRPFYKHGKAYMTLTITQHYDPECLLVFQRTFGEGKIHGPYKNQNGELVVWQYKANGQVAHDIARAIRPLLTDGGKGGQVDDALDRFRDQKEWRSYRPHNADRRCTLCDKKHYAKDLCHYHYHKARREA